MSIPRARRLARAVRERAQVSVPVDPVRVARAHGLEVRSRSNLQDADGNALSGLLLREPGVAVCVVDASDAMVRRRFTVAHELGHFLLHPARDTYLDPKWTSAHSARDHRASEGVYRREIEANAFAAELLMPEEELRARIPGSLGPWASEEVIAELAEEFRVSREAMTHRLTRLALLTAY